MKVLKIIHTMGHGGAENVFRWLAWGLRESNIDVVAGIPLKNDPGKKEDWITPALEEFSIPYETFDKTGSSTDFLRNMNVLIRKANPDIVHSHLLGSNFYSSVSCRYLSVPHVCTEHGNVLLNSPFASKIKFVLLSIFSKAIVCVSEAVRAKAIKLAVFPKKIGLIYNGISFHNDGHSTFRNEMGIPSDALLIGSVGNLYPVKGHEYLIKAYSRFLHHDPNSYLVLVGRGEQENNLKSLASTLRIPKERIVFTGFRKDVGNVLSSFGIYVQPSLSEGHPLSLLEAMSLGIPVIATNVGGVREILGDDEYGLMVPARSSEALCNAMMKVAQNMKRFKKRARLAKTFTRETFSIERMTREYIKLYERTLDDGAD